MKSNPQVLGCWRTLLLCASLGLTMLVIPAEGQEFQEIDGYGWSRGINLATPAITDLDGNGLLDLIVGSNYSGLGWWEQTAPRAETFRRVDREFLPREREARWAPLLVDLDGNGRKDILMGVSGGYILWYEESATGNLDFRMVTDHVGDLSFDANGRLWLGDLDGDGRRDLLVGSSATETRRYVQRTPFGTEFDRVRSLVYSEWHGAYHHPFPYDLDGDGVLEMIVSIHEGNVFLYRQDPVVKDSFLLVTKNWSGITDAYYGAPAITDIDDDGLLDLYIGTLAGHVQHYEQPSIGAIDGWVQRGTNVIGTWDFGLNNSGFIADLDRDGRLDVIRSEVTEDTEPVHRPLQHFRQQRVGSYEVEYVGTFSGLTMRINESATITDLESDGQLDLLVYRLSQGLEHYRQSAVDPFHFDLVTGEFLPGMFITHPSIPTCHDIDGNGRMDLILACTDRRLFRYEADGPGSLTFTLVEDPWLKSSEYYPAVCFFDYENDGVLDMVQGTQDGKLRHWRQTAAGSTTFARVDSPISRILAGGKSQPSVFDVNGDGRDDLVVVDGSGGISLFVDEGPNAVRTIPRPVNGPELLAPYPQPAEMQLVIPYRAPVASEVTLILSDLLGRERYRVQVAARSDIQTTTIPVSALVPGVYQLRAVQGCVMTQRMVVVE